MVIIVIRMMNDKFHLNAFIHRTLESKNHTGRFKPGVCWSVALLPSSTRPNPPPT